MFSKPFLLAYHFTKIDRISWRHRCSRCQIRISGGKKKRKKRVDFGFRGGSGWMHSLRIVTEKKLGRRRGCRRHKTIDRKDGEWLVGGTANKSSWNSGCRKPVMFSIQCAKEEIEFSGISWVEFFLFFFFFSLSFLLYCLRIHFIKFLCIYFS